MVKNKSMHPKYVLLEKDQIIIEQKTKELYEKRIAPYVKDISVSQKEIVLNLQKIIFIIDHYGESVEKIESAMLDSFFNDIEHFLEGLMIKKEIRATLLGDIKDYAYIEASTREGKKLSDLKIGYFYLKKSCDVRLQRHILRYLNKQQIVSTEDEIIRDMLEEIEDDIDDIEEDRQSLFNGNRFLEALNSNDALTLEEYRTFINSFKDTEFDLTRRIVCKIEKAEKCYT